MPASDLNLPITQTDAFKKRLAKRNRADQRFRLYGIGAVLIALGLLVTLISSIVIEARSAFTRHELSLELELTQTDSLSVYQSIRNATGELAGDAADENVQIDIARLVSRLAAGPITEALHENGADLSRRYPVEVTLSDEADRYLKGLVSPVGRFDLGEFEQIGDELTGDFSASLALVRNAFRTQIEQIRHDELRSAERMQAGLERQVVNAPGDRQLILRADGAASRVNSIVARVSALEARLNATVIDLDDSAPGILIRTDEGWFKVVRITEESVQVESLLSGLEQSSLTGQLLVVERPLDHRSISDAQIAAVEELSARGLIHSRFNTSLFSQSDSSDPEFAGVLSGLIGSVMIVLVTMMLAVPVGIAAAVYLEEFAPRNRVTSFIQININNLAAIPSIVFGLLGAAIFVNGVIIPLPFFDGVFRIGGGLGRGWPLVGGIVLALMTLPTIIIASRAALGAVPRSVRQAALAMGATRLQTTNHHVLPMAAPGILTGSIIGLAQAIGETAPLLLIGMVAFVGELPQGMSDRATALPVLIFQWSTRAERAWEPMTSAAIIILLLVMLALNGLAVLMRLRYEK